MTDFYIEPQIETDPDRLAETAFTHLQDNIPGWVPNDGNLETILIEAHALMAAEVRDVASAVPTSIFRRMGELIGIEPLEATSASVLSTWTMVNNAGYTISAGTFVGIRSAGDVLVPFFVDVDYVINPGSTSRADIRLIAVNPGEASSGLGAPAGPMELITARADVATITQNTITTGGVDAETDDEYLDRFTQRLRLLSPRPILPEDFSTLAQDHPSVGRALALDGYNPADSTFNNERMVAVAVTDTAGEPLDGATKNAIDVILESEREITFVVNVIDATYTIIDVDVDVKARAGYQLADVEARVEAALADYLDPATWGYEPPQGDAGEPVLWEQTTTVRWLELVTLVNNVDGVDYVTDLDIRKGADPYTSADIALTGAAPLTRPGSIVANVT